MAVIDQFITDRYALYNGDSCEVLTTMPAESIHLSIYSPPFAVDGGRGCLYQYSSSERDLSNNATYELFFQHYEIIVSELTRITMPGRISAVHTMDVPLDGANIAGYADFPGDIIRLYRRYGWDYLPRIHIWKEPLDVRNRTMMRSLTHKQIVNDSTLTNVAAGDYLLPFRKNGKNPIPVVHPRGLVHYAGEREIPHDLKRYRNWKGNQIENRYSQWIWRQYASSSWDDIRGNTGRRKKKGASIRDQGVLPYKEARDEKDERHVHPLQLDVIERACVLWSNPGETILTPFMGVGSEVFGSLINDRKAVGIELKPTYYRQALKNCEAALNYSEEQDELALCHNEETELEEVEG
jgi:hypothetical protein